MIVAPVPIRLAIIRFQLPVIGMGAMIFRFPAGVSLAFGRTPGMIIPMRRVVVASMNGAIDLPSGRNFS